MLKQRVITAVVLIGVLLGVLFLLPWQVFAVFAGLVFVVGAWEWANLSGLTATPGRLGYALLIAAAGAGLGYVSDWSRDTELVRSVLMVACGWWALALLWIQGYPASAILWRARPVRALMGAVVLIPAWLACLYLLLQPGGAILILAVVAIVACADIGAYFSGRAFGKHKLAASVSPGKSWEGVWGGLICVCLLSLLLQWLANIRPWWLPLVAALPAAFVSVVGDLLESMVKRHRGVKDSSQLLPGHGGILDRVDGLVAAVPVYTLALMVSGWEL